MQLLNGDVQPGDTVEVDAADTGIQIGKFSSQRLDKSNESLYN